jgi:hypothetical protein
MINLSGKYKEAIEIIKDCIDVNRMKRPNINELTNRFKKLYDNIEL